MNNANPAIHQYHSRYTWAQLLSFGLMFMAETFLTRDLSRLMRWQIGRPPIEVHGAENLPDKGVFIFAVNHFKSGQVVGLFSAVMAAAERYRPELLKDYLLVVGQKVSSHKRSNGVGVKLARRFAGWIKTRWKKNLLHIALGNDRPNIACLRDWRRRAGRQPVILFPEGKADLQFNGVRNGAGRWLASIDSPTIPVGVWWRDDKWHVRFGKSVEWTGRAELRDVQLGLSMAALLPADIAESWQDDLDQWRTAHSLITEGGR
jgi:hypothetical protein